MNLACDFDAKYQSADVIFCRHKKKSFYWGIIPTEMKILHAIIYFKFFSIFLRYLNEFEQ